MQKLRAEMTNLYGPLHLHKAHSTIPSHRESIMVAESWNFYPSHGTGLHTDVDEIHVYAVCILQLIKTITKFSNIIGYHQPKLSTNWTVYASCW